ncbi:MAG: CsbD family protein [Verrucomicrobiota bacterium]|nr:CsbD family protein [Verrucomicrobiota bacterium]
MNALEVKGNWNIAKGRLKQKLAQWMDDQSQFTEGKEEELLGRIQKRSGQAKRDAGRVMGSCGCHK